MSRPVLHPANSSRASRAAFARSLEGVAHEQIARTAKRQGVGLIVMGTHRRTGVARFFLGSVAARDAATAPPPRAHGTWPVGA